MSNQTEHTPTTWKLIRGTSEISIPKHNYCLCEGWQRKSIAKHIVKCVNAHDALVSALKSVTEDLQALIHTESCDHPAGICWCGVRTDINEAETALKVAGIEVPK